MWQVRLPGRTDERSRQGLAQGLLHLRQLQQEGRLHHALREGGRDLLQR